MLRAVRTAEELEGECERLETERSVAEGRLAAMVAECVRLEGEMRRSQGHKVP